MISVVYVENDRIWQETPSSTLLSAAQKQHMACEIHVHCGMWFPGHRQLVR